MFADLWEKLLRGLVFEEATGNAADGREDDGGDEFGVAVEAFGCGAEERGGVAEGSGAHGFCDAHAVDVGGDGVEAGAVVDVVELGVEVGVDECGGLVEDADVARRFADGFDRRGDVVQVATECGLQKRALVGEVLVERADGDSGTMCD